MIIGIDAGSASPQFGGLATYATNIIASLSDLSKDLIFAFIPEGREISSNLTSKLSHQNILVIKRDSAAPTEPWAFRSYWEQTILPAQLTKYNLDVFFGPAFMAPLKWTGPKVVTVHDLFFEWAPQEYKDPHSPAYYHKWAKRCAAQANAIITVSQCVASDIGNIWKLHDVPVSAVHLAPGPSFFPESLDIARSAVARRFAINSPYILSVGDNNPRKNIPGLIRAFSYVDIPSSFPPLLVLVTAQGEVESVAARYGVLERTVITGYCDPELLRHLYAAAAVVVLPSFYESFGLPLVEAMACGTPVIASNKGALPEIAGNAALLVDPADISAMVYMMKKLLLDNDLRSSLVAKGFDRAHDFSWRETARKTREILVTAAKS